MKAIKIFHFFPIVLAIFILSGCGSQTQLYPGPKLPDNKVALLKSDYYSASALSIDGVDLGYRPSEQIDRPSEQTVAMLPGEHKIVWSGSIAPDYNHRIGVSNSGTLDAKAGKKYYIYSTYDSTTPHMGTFSGWNFRTRIGDSFWGDYVESEDFTPD